MIDTILTIPDDGFVGIDVRVQEYTGKVVAKLDSTVDIRRLCAQAANDPARYPLLAGVDDHDDTYFNARQARSLASELTTLAAAHPEPDVITATTRLIALANLLQAAPGRPHHRQLIFIGD